jgi:septal ring factor EnvC (AmiA/AmiB activator)
VDVEKTLAFLLENAARSSARMDRIETVLEQNQKLTFQLITLMSGQQSALAKLSKALKETNEALKETNEALKETNQTVNALGKRMDAFLSGLARVNGRGRKNKG